MNVTEIKGSPLSGRPEHTDEEMRSEVSYIIDKKRSRNNGEMPKYYVEGCHEPIIDRAVFLLVQEEMARRASLRSRDKPRTYSSKYALSGIVFCPHCGGNYRRVGLIHQRREGQCVAVYEPPGVLRRGLSGENQQ